MALIKSDWEIRCLFANFYYNFTMQATQIDTGFHVGQNLDVLDSVNKWMNAEVIFTCNDRIFVHYTGWSIKYDEEIQINSPRILTQWYPGKTIALNNRIDAYHPLGGWLEARVIEIGEKQQNSQAVKVHFLNYHKKYDIWVDLHNNNETAIIGSRSKAYGMGKNRSKGNKSKLSQIALKILIEKLKKLQSDLNTRDLIIKKSTGDGNCLFRSVSDQLYGDQKYHQEIRKVCMDYIALEKDFFRDYVTEDIDEYIEMKRKDGEWGDDVQVQALSEIYARPIEIYVFGTKPIRTFHQENQREVEPMKLAYIGACHYDSIQPKQNQNRALMQTQCGQFQKLFLQTYKSDMNSIMRNRNIFSTITRLEDAVGQHIDAQDRNEVKIQDELTKAIQISQRQAILQEIQNAQLQRFQQEYEQQKIQEDLKKIQQKQIQEAKKMSKGFQQKQTYFEKPYWFSQLVAQGFSQKQILFAIEVKGYDPDAVQNFLLDNICI